MLADLGLSVEVVTSRIVMMMMTTLVMMMMTTLVMMMMMMIDIDVKWLAVYAFQNYYKFHVMGCLIETAVHQRNAIIQSSESNGTNDADDITLQTTHCDTFTSVLKKVELRCSYINNNKNNNRHQSSL